LIGLVGFGNALINPINPTNLTNPINCRRRYPATVRSASWLIWIFILSRAFSM